jgi:hypothetical protein
MTCMVGTGRPRTANTSNIYSIYRLVGLLRNEEVNFITMMIIFQVGIDERKKNVKDKTSIAKKQFFDSNIS